ncbi:MAG TPA: trehalose-6-phosphate synthase, partial [Ktedonobacteraceae bacterium]
MRKAIVPDHVPTTILHADHLIIATNRGPVEYYRSRDQTLKARRGAGGVVTALLGAMQQIPTTWVALAMTDGDRQAAQEAPAGVLPTSFGDQQMQLRYVVVPKTVYRLHYDTISNRGLWFLQHYIADYQHGFPSTDTFAAAWERGYQQANQAIADAVCAALERERNSATVVMLHDYHLYLVPAQIRRCHPWAVLQQFIHIPWPEVRYWQSFLPNTLMLAIYRGLLGNDIVGFQTQRDVHNFLEGVRTLLADAKVEEKAGYIYWQNHRTLVRDYPISIDVSDERRLVQSATGKRATERIQPHLGEQTIMRVDRIEPTKNIVQGFQGYERLLELHPEVHGRVKFLAFLVPSRQSIPAYRHYQAEVLTIIEQINRRYGRSHWIPIEAFIQNDRLQALAAMQYYDVLLVNSLIDGMNLVAKEGPILNQRHGVLVLSRTSGAFQQLERASIPVTPASVEEAAEALYQALTLSSEERARKAELARQEVEQHDLLTWIAQQVH